MQSLGTVPAAVANQSQTAYEEYLKYMYLAYKLQDENRVYKFKNTNHYTEEYAEIIDRMLFLSNYMSDADHEKVYQVSRSIYGATA